MNKTVYIKVNKQTRKIGYSSYTICCKAIYPVHTVHKFVTTIPGNSFNPKQQYDKKQLSRGNYFPKY